MSDNNIIKEIVEQADIVSIIGKYIKLTPKGKDFIGICPFHHDTSPSLSVSPSRKMFKCFVCGVGGDVIKFVEKFEKISYSEALKKVAKLINYEIKNTKYSDPKKEKDTKILNTANDYFQRILFNEENKKFLDYLYKRGLNDKDISFFNLGFGGENNVIYKLLSNKNNNLKFNQNNFNDQELKDAGLISINKDGEANFLFNNRIIFPIFDASNSLVGFSGRIIEKKSDASKYQNSPNSYIFSKEKILYNMNNAKNNLKNEIVICEGYMDTIAYYKSDIKNVVATMGLFLSNYTISLIKSYENIKTVVLSFDSDNAGINTTINNARKLIDNGYIVLVVEDFSNIAKDMDEVLIKFGKEKVNEFFNNKTDYIYWYIKNTFKNFNKKNNDLSQLQINFQLISEEINNYGSNLLINKYIELLSEITGIKKEQVESEISKKTPYKKIIAKQENKVIGQDTNFINVIRPILEKILVLLIENKDLYSKFEESIKINQYLPYFPEIVKMYKLFYMEMVSKDKTKTIFLKDVEKSDVELFLILKNYIEIYKSSVSDKTKINKTFEQLIDNLSKNTYIYLIKVHKDDMEKIKTLKKGWDEYNKKKQAKIKS